MIVNIEIALKICQGEDEVVVPAKYIGKIAGSTLTGSLDTTDDDLKCNYKLDKLDAQPARGIHNINTVLLRDMITTSL